MFDELFKTDTKTDTKTSTTTSKPTGMFSDLFQTESKQATVTPQVTPTEQITPIVTTPKKTLFSTITGGLKSFWDEVSKIPTKEEADTALKNIKKGQSMDFPLISSSLTQNDILSSSKNIDETVNNLKTKQLTLDKTDKNAVDQYNTEVQKYQDQILKHNTDLKEYNTAIDVHNNVFKENLATSTPILRSFSNNISNLATELLIKIPGESLSNTQYMKDVAVGTNLAEQEGKPNFGVNFAEEMTRKLSLLTKSVGAFTGGILNIDPPKPEETDFSDKIVSMFAQGVGIASGLGLLEAGISKTIPSIAGMSTLTAKYPTMAKYAVPFMRTATAFTAYGQLNQTLDNASFQERLKTASIDFVKAIPYFALGLTNKAWVSIPASGLLGYGAAKLDGATNEDAIASGISFMALDGFARASAPNGTAYKRGLITQQEARGTLNKQAIEIINQYSDIKITEKSSKIEIEQAFRSAAKKTHPDITGSDVEFKKVNGAKDILLPHEVSEKIPEATPEKSPEPKETKMGQAVDSVPNMRQEVSDSINSVGPVETYNTLKNTFGMDSKTAQDVIKNVMDQSAIEQTKQTQEMTHEEIIKQALNEAGSTLEETKTGDAVTEQPKLKISKEEPLITEAKKYKSAEEFVKAIRFRGEPTFYGDEFGTNITETKNGIPRVLSGSGGIPTSKSFITARGFGNEVRAYIPKPDAKILSNPEEIIKIAKVSSPNHFFYRGNKQVPAIDGVAFYERAKQAGYDAVDLTDIEKLHRANPSENTVFLKGAEEETRIINRSAFTEIKNPPKTKSQLEDIWNKAQGEAKMKLKIESTKKLLAKIDQDIAGNIDYLIKEANLLSKKGKLRLSEISDLEEIQAKVIKNKLTKEDRLLYNEIAKKLGREDLLPTNTLDIENAKIDNKEYEQGTRYKQGNNGGLQDNGTGIIRSDGKLLLPHTLQERSQDGGISIISRRHVEGYYGYESRELFKKQEKIVRQAIEDFIPEAQPDTIDQIVSYYFQLSNDLEINRVVEIGGTKDFFAGINPFKGDKYELFLNDKFIARIPKEHIYHEIGGHAWYESISEEQRENHFNKIKELYNSDKSLFDNFTDNDRKVYWGMNLNFLKFHVANENGLLKKPDIINKIFREAGLQDENNKVITPEDVLDTVFNFEKINDNLNRVIKENGYQPSLKTLEYNNLMADELNSYIAENAETFKDLTIEEISKYSNDILNNTLEFGTALEFGGAKLKLKDSTKLTSEDIIKKHANIELKRDIVITDVYGEKSTIKAGEGITPYEVTGNKFILQDGEAYLVSKSQAQNVINNSKTGEAKPFAPELKQTEETVKGISKWRGNELIQNGETVANIIRNENDTWSYQSDFSEGEEEFANRALAMQEAQANTTGDVYGVAATKFTQYTLPGGEDQFEINILAPYKKGDATYKVPSAHSYGDKSDINRISHVRGNFRTYEGKKVLFMEELQSDWAREGRDKGFGQQMTELPEGYEVKPNKAYGYIVQDTAETVTVASGKTKAEVIANALKELNQQSGKVPSNPLLKNWQELSIKRALQEAVNSNAKYFAWINGPQTAARYNLSKQVDNIDWKPFNDGKAITINPIGGSAIEVFTDENGLIKDNMVGKNMPSEWKGKNIADAIGKGISEKIMQEKSGSLKGDGLNVGGAWAGNLYDRQVRTIVENLTGQKVEMLDMGLPVDSKKENLFRNYTATPNMEKPVKLTEKNMKVGDEIADGANKFWIITKINGNGKFIAVEKNVWERANDYTITKKRSMPSFEIENVAGFEDAKESFDIAEPKATQMGIKLTPEVKQIINGEAPQVKVSGKLPFTEQITAPVMFKIKLPEVNTGSKLEDAKQILAHVEQKLGVSSIVNSLKEKEALLEVAKESLNESPMKELEPYVADSGAYKGELPEVVGKKIEEIKKNPDFKGVKNQKALEFAQKGDVIVEGINMEYGTNLDSEDARLEFEKYQKQKESIAKREKEFKQQVQLFGKTDSFKLAGQDQTLIGEITQTREMPQTIMEIMDQVKKEKKSRREEVLNHPARPLMKYIDRKTKKLPKIGSNTAFGKEGTQILKDLKFEDIKEANESLADYMVKRDEFVNPLSKLRLEERNAKFLRDKQKIIEEVEKKIKAEARDRKQIIESIRDYFYMTDSEMRDILGNTDYRLLNEAQFKELTQKIEEESLKIAEHSVAVSEVEWTIAEKELHRVENMQEVLGYPKDLNKLTTEELDNLNTILGKYQRGDVFLGVREMETLAKNANLPDVKTQRQILEEVLGKRTGLPIEKLREIVTGSFDDLRSAVSLSRQNAFYEVLVSDFYQLKIEAGLRYREIEQKTAELVKKARASRPQSWKQRLAPTDDMVIAYLEEGDLETRAKIAKDMSNAELELAHYVKERYAEMRDFLIARQQLEKERQNYYTHRPRGFFESWLRNEVVKTPTQFIRAFGRAFKETFIDVNKMDEATFKILNEQTEEILPLEKFFKYSMRRSGQLIPTKNLANAFLGYTKTFELKRGLDQYMPRMEAVARALTPTETTEGGVAKDTSLEKFVKKWINTQKGRPVTVGPIQPGGTLDGLLRGGVAFTRFLDLALRLPAQFMSLVGEETATWINIGTKKYIIGEYRAKTPQGKKIVNKYEAFVGTKFWDKMREESSGVANKLGETLFALYGIAARNANIHHLLGVLTKQEFESGNITPERLVEIKKEMNRWRADDLLHSVMGKTSIGAALREHKSWAFPIINQTLSNIKTLSKMVGNGEYKQAGKSKEFSELFRGTMLTLLLVLTISRMYKDLQDKKDRSLVEELEYRAMNDAFSFLSALNPTTITGQARLFSWLEDLGKAVTSFAGAMATGERTKEGKIPGLKQIADSVTPKLLKPLFTPTGEDKIATSISTSTIKAQTELDKINRDIAEPAQKAWDEVKKLGVGTEEADALVGELSDEEYETYKLVKKADQDYWTSMAEKVTPIVNQAFKLEFGSEESNKLVEDLTDDEYAMYKTVKSNLYGKGEATAQPTDWDKQSFITHVKNMAKGWTTDPVDAFNKIIKGGDWKITEISNGQIIVNRMPVEASEKIKEEAAKKNENYKLDHVWPVKGGGGSDKQNLNIISTEEWEENTPVEVYLIKQLKAGNITGEELKEYAVKFKIGRGQVNSGPLFEKYKTPLTFEEIKNIIAK